MAFQSEVGSGSARATSRFDWLNKRVSFMTSRHVASVAVNVGGTGYVTGDIIRITHVGAHLDAKCEVTAAAGIVTGLEILSSGAFGDRPNGTITISAGGTGYAATATDVILELQTGVSRCPAKVQATTNGSGVVTSAVAFEDLGSAGLGVYSTLPTYPAATVIVGPNATAAGTGCTITMGGSSGIIGTTGLATTHDTGAGDDALTVNITLAETGWAVDGRNTNSNLINTSDPDDDKEKQVVLKGDAAGLTNKPVIAYATFTEDVSTNVHAGIAAIGMIAHNPGVDLSAQTPRSLGVSSETAMNTTGAFSMMFVDSGTGFGTVDLWMNADDVHFREIAQLDENAGSVDSGLYWHHYVGLLDRIGTETENPYPLYIFSSSRDPTIAPTANSTSNTGLVELRSGSGGPCFLYNNLTGLFVDVRNADGAASPGVEPFVCHPAALLDNNDVTTDADNVFRAVHENDRSIAIFGSDNGAGSFDKKIFNHADRAVPYRNLRWIPGTVSLPFLWPLTVATKTGNTAAATDRLFGNVRGVYFITSDDGTGARIANFSEDYVTIAGVRYLVFHNTNQNNYGQYLAFRMDV